jgi:drug/metabolite transporter (DMT)-like permease
MFVIAGLGAAVAYGVAMVLQQRGARTVPVEASLRAGLVVQLLRRRLWLVGVACNLAAFGLRGLALSDGSLAVVQPVILLGLFVALSIEARLDRRVLGSTEVLGSLALIGGLVLFVLAAGPGRGRPDALPVDWLALGTVVGGAALLAVAWASRLTGEARAAGLAAVGVPAR